MKLSFNSLLGATLCFVIYNPGIFLSLPIGSPNFASQQNAKKKFLTASLAKPIPNLTYWDNEPAPPITLNLPPRSRYISDRYVGFPFPGVGNIPAFIAKNSTHETITATISIQDENGIITPVTTVTVKPRVELIGLEVIQVIQDWQNSISLVEGKTTIVRAHLQLVAGATLPDQFKAYLIARRGQQVLHPSITPKNEHDFVLPSNIALPPSATGEKDIIDRRNKIEKSLFFEVPTDWITPAGKIEFELASQSGIVCNDPTGSCKTTVEFKSSKIMKVKFWIVEWTDKDQTNYRIDRETADFFTDEREENILSLFPIGKIESPDWERHNTGDFDFQAQKVAIPPRKPHDELFNKVIKELELRRYDDIDVILDPSILYMSVIKGPFDQPRTLNGKSSFKSRVGVIHIAANDNTVSHELGHLLGRDHPRKINSLTYCNEPEEESFDYGFPTHNELTNPLRPGIGPMSQGINKLVYGYDSYKDEIKSPKISFELMSYCDKSERWISDYTYKALITAIESRFKEVATFSATPLQMPVNVNKSLNYSQVSANYKFFRGTINLDNNQVNFDPVVLSQLNTAPPLPMTGEYQLQLLNEQNNIIKTVDFEPTNFIRQDGSDPNEAFFIIPVFLDELVKKAIILKNNVVIGEKTASNNPPIVKVLFPNGGESLNDTSAIFRWEAEDADGDLLTYKIQFSKDGGSKWKTLDIDFPKETYEADLSLLGEVNNAMIRVIASDGFNVAMDESDSAFSTPNSVPSVFIASPLPNKVFTVGESVIFRGRARDVEDGNLSGPALVWSSNLDGVLGYGEYFLKPTAELKEGEHIVMLTALDKAGASKSTSRKIKVQRFVAPPSSFTVTCPDDISVSSDAGKCYADVGFTATTTSTPASTIVYNLGTTVITSPYSFPVGTTSVMVTASNGLEPDVSCSFMVTVRDNENPTLICPATTILCYNTSGSYSIAALQAADNCGIQSYSYSITGATTRSGSGADASGAFNPGTSTIEWTVTDIKGNINSCQAIVEVALPLNVSIPDAKALSEGVDPNTVYIGYSPASSITLNAQVSGGSGNLTYKWSTGATNPSIILSPTTTTTYSVTITDGFGCPNLATKQVNVVDVRCGNKNDKVQICKVPPDNPSSAHNSCISDNAVADNLAEGSFLGVCENTSQTSSAASNRNIVAEAQKVNGLMVKAIPNPSNQFFTLDIRSANSTIKVNLRVFDNSGRVVESKTLSANAAFKIGTSYHVGVYHAEITQGSEKLIIKLIKY